MASEWCCFLGSENCNRYPGLPYEQSQFVGLKKFSYEQLRKATNDFGMPLGEGICGIVYKGRLDDDGDNQQIVAVKHVHRTSGFCEKAFIAEAGIISQLNHGNVSKKPIGWCSDEGQFLLVYEYMPNGSLADVLHNDTRCLDLKWDQRFEIAKGVASALLYLHVDGSEKANALHRDLKPSNVLLNESFVPKLGDFGLSRQVQKGGIWRSTPPAGSRG